MTRQCDARANLYMLIMDYLGTLYPSRVKESSTSAISFLIKSRLVLIDTYDPFDVMGLIMKSCEQNTHSFSQCSTHVIIGY
jgi:hypothetical protein